MSLARAREYDVLVLAALIWFLGKFVRYAFPPLFGPLQASYGVSNAAVGAAFSGFMAVYAALQFPSGAIADRVGAVRVIAAGAAVAGVGALSLIVDTSFAVLAGVMLVIGAGTGAHKTVAVRLLSRVYPVRTGRALGAHDTFGALGGVAAPAAVTLFVAAPPALAVLLSWLPGADWRGLFALTGVVALALAAAFSLRVPGRLPADADRGPDREGPDPGARDYLSLFEDRRVAGFVLVTIAFSFAYNGAVAFLPLYLSQAGGLSTATANLLYSGLFAVTFVQLVSGDLSDRLGRFPVMVAALGLAAAALVGVVAVAETGPVVLGALVVAFGLGSHGFRPVRGAYLIEALPERLAGGGLGVVRTLLMAAGALAPATVGAVADASGFRAAFGLLAGALALAAGVAAGLWLTE
ncbi:MFS transporter [Halorubrum persicum]|uniref:MFS transporter n=1 Tax=Halorubrum persicum TaxID=1383844 RepID=A0A2G1WMT2_9EURY|nr:MFS transporter [Halorubrum persicum]PHQ40263.1 MFS transporter [Halorubrum persicum]